MNTAKQKAPPKTVPSKTIIKQVKTAQIDIKLYVEVLRDTTKSGLKGGETTYKPVGSLPGGKLYRTPTYSWQQKGGPKTISKVNGPAEIKATVQIQTAYGANAKPSQTSEYGRGTTTTDEKTGNTTLGFHESCHRKDYIDYLKTKPLPTFGGKVGITEQQFKQAEKSFAQSVAKYFKDMDDYSERLTDEVGYKKSIYKAKGSRQKKAGRTK
jgi:hypothetical protein